MAFRYSFLVVLLLLSACSHDDTPLSIEIDSTDCVEIELDSGVSHQLSVTTPVISRGDGVLGGNLSEDLPISFVRIDELSAGTYPSDYTDADAVTQLNGDLVYKAGEAARRVRFGSPQYYLLDGRHTKFFGWYPQSGAWNEIDGAITFPVIDGSTDILMAHGVDGSKLENERFNDTDRLLSFTHALTLVRVFIKAEKAEYISHWGEVTDIEFVGKQQPCVFTLPADLSGTVIGTSFPVTGASDLKMIGKDTTSPHGNLPLSAGIDADDYTEVGYAMFAPHLTSSDELGIRITTVNGGKQPIKNVPYSEAPLKAGKEYHIRLLFKSTEVTFSGVTINNWTAGTGGNLILGDRDN